ncbi:SCP-like protein [Ancylostoma caninum]|uniref:SCP-like protein n=1 Tax=Ancylostoma caninum TaxID=29170 RepID=A0A368FSI7_ANCCA|nr:SCP-like protein [Ancylostoma caninum]
MRLIVALLAVTSTVYAAQPFGCQATDIDDKTRQKILDFHNQKREDVAKGLVPNFNSAKNMYKLRWSCILERRAKKYSLSCPNQLNKMMGLGGHGMNMVHIETEGSPDLDWAIDGTLKAWWAPAEQYHLRPKGPDNRYPGENFASVASIINSETTQVGCSYNVCPQKGNQKTKLTILCLYDDVAYLQNRVLYDTGRHCTEDKDCTTYRRSTCDTKTGLCVKPKDTANDYENKMCKVRTGMTDKVRNTFLDLHNDFRSLVASGKAEDKLIDGGKGFAPKAASMRKLEYDCKLEEMAAKYAEKCVYEHSPNVSRMLLGEEAGENLFTVSVFDVDYNKAAEWATRGWFRELKDNGVGAKNILTRELLDRSKKINFEEMKIGHYTQMVWGETDRIGCGIKHCYGDKGDRKEQTLVVCNYLVFGNIANHTIYEIGKEPCEKCPQGYKCENNLCARLKPRS